MGSDMMETLEFTKKNLALNGEAVIYALINPVSKQIKYIGSTKIPQQRLVNHINSTANNGVSLWIKELLFNGFKPEIILIEKISILDIKIKEKYWINYYMNLEQNLLNANYLDGSIKVVSRNNGSGGARSGAGRPESLDKKKLFRIYLTKSKIDQLEYKYGKENARLLIEKHANNIEL